MKESFEERHGDNISRLKFVLIVACLVAIPVTFWFNHRDVGSVNSRITKIESPCLRYGARSKQCKEAFEQAVLTINHAQACAILRKAGLEIENCRGARLKQEVRRGKERDASSVPDSGIRNEGVVDTNGHAPSSQPGPPSHGGHQGGQGHSGTPHPLTPQPSPAPAAPAPIAPTPTPGNSGSTPGADSGLKACVEVAVSACAEVHAETPELSLHP